MTDRIFSIAELEEVATGLLPEALRDRVSVHMCAVIQVKPLTVTREGRAAIAERLATVRAARMPR